MRWLATGKIDGAASIAGAWCACCARRAIASVALTLAASPGFGVYVTYYLLTSRNPLILQRILDGWLATVSHESARSAKMALILAGVWLLVDYPSGLLGLRGDRRAWAQSPGSAGPGAECKNLKLGPCSLWILEDPELPDVLPPSHRHRSIRVVYGKYRQHRGPWGA